MDAISVDGELSARTLFRIAAELIAITVATVLLWSAIGKAFSPLQAQRLATALVPDLPAKAIVATVCLLEVGIASLLIARWRRQLMFSMLAVMILSLTFAFWYARAKGHIGGCGCFGSAGNSGVAGVFLRNGGLIVACVLGWQLTSRVSSARAFM